MPYFQNQPPEDLPVGLPPASPDRTTDQIVAALKSKSGTKQFIYRRTAEIYRLFREEIKRVAMDVSVPIKHLDRSIMVSAGDIGEFETELKFSGDTLLYLMHTNVFTFPPEHAIFKTEYVRQDPMRAYVGMIMIYDFLSDSIKYNRMNDIGYLIARIFINCDGKFFIQGKRQFAFMYNDFSPNEIDAASVRLIVQTSILHTIDFDLYVPPFDTVKEITLRQKMLEAGNASLKTGKRLGFTYRENED